jgi:hypothetical protein
MEYEENTLTEVQAPEESKTIDESLVKLQRTWVFWENYESKSGEKLEWSQSIKKVFSFDDIISFWQFLNNYPGSNPANIFYNGERVR